LAIDRSPAQRIFMPVTLERGGNVALSCNVVKPMTTMNIGSRRERSRGHETALALPTMHRQEALR
jgi:hypothetical protein